MIPRDPLEVESIARDCSRRAQNGEFAIAYTTHARERMEQRNISEKEVETVLGFGKVQIGQEKWNDRQQEYSYLLRDRNLDERDVALAIGVREDKTGNVTTVITAELIDPKTGQFL